MSFVHRPRPCGGLECGQQRDALAGDPSRLAPLVSELRLKLFIAGDSPRARAAASDLARVCHEYLDGEPVIETIDVLLQPELADAYCVLTTPTVLREFPLPRRRATGDLHDAARLLAALALRSTRST